MELTAKLIATTRWIWVALAAIAAPIAMAKGSADAGAAKAAACIACHGVGGNSVNDQWPSLAGQNAAYIMKQLHEFHAKGRTDYTALMGPMVAPLGDQDIEDLAAYFSAQTPTGLEADPSYWQAGEKLYRGGDRARGIPACMACHGPEGAGNPDAGYPALRGQHSGYTMKQLTDYAAGARYPKNDKGEDTGGANAEFMHTIAGRLNQEDIRNLASYIQGIR